MNKHFITIILLLLCLLISRPAEARLTLGVVTGPDDAAGGVALAQADSLASLLAEKLQEEVVVKTLADSATLIDWLDRFAMLDLALLSTAEVKANPGRFLQLGPFDQGNRFNLVARQGVAGDLPQRVGTIVRESGFVFREDSGAISTTAQQSPEEMQPLATSEPGSAAEVIAAQVELQHVPALTPGRAWSPQEEVTFRDILPADDPATKKLVLGVSPDPGGLMRSAQQAEQLATYLEQVLPISVKVREFTSTEAFAEWFMRYRMVDVAILAPAFAKAKLGRDYLSVAKLFRVDKPGPESAALVVMRRGQNEAVQVPLQRALLDMVQTERGQALMAALAISEVLAPQDVLAQPAVVEQEPEPVMETEPRQELAEEQAEELLPPPAQYADPIEPVAPLEVQALLQLPELPEVAAPVAMMPRPAEADVAQTLPEPVAIPAEPVSLPIVEAIILPEIAARQSEPLPTSEPEMPLLAATDAPMAPAELITIAEPELPVAVVDPVEPLLVVALPLLEDIVIPDSAASVAKERPEATVVVEEVLSPTEIVPSPESAEMQPASIEPSTEAWSDEEYAAVLGEDLVAAVVAQPNIPQEFRPSGIPVVRPGRVTRRTTIDEDELLVASIPAPLKIVEPPRLPDLLPEPEPEPGVIYIVPFVAIMVPDEVNARIFDQFVDLLNQGGDALGLQFVILKEGLQRISPEWLEIRQYVTGEIYAYVEDSSCCATDLRTKASLTYRRPNQNIPAFGFNYPVKSFFDHDRSTLNIERAKLSDDIAATLAGELLKALQN